MPNRAHPRVRLALFIAVTAGLFGCLSGVATADTASPTPTGSPSTSSDSGPSTSPTTSPASITSNSSAESSSSPTTSAAASRSARVRSARVRARRRHAGQVQAVLREVSRQRGKPYSYGADGPRAFDCSGLVRFVFGHAVGRWLPHNAEEQYRAVRHIPRRDLQPGDLVFEESGGYAFHVGIYAGHGKWWDAPHTGSHVQKQRVFGAHHFYGRVLTLHPARHDAHRARHHAHHARHHHHRRR
jgi:cell wall-associated NlpC family hydrolase